MKENLTEKNLSEAMFEAIKAIYRFERLEVKTFDLTVQQVYLLKFLRRKSPLNVTQIADELRVQPFTATRTVDCLEEKKLVERVRDTKDRRVIRVSITKKGIELVDRLEKKLYGVLMNNFKELSKESAANFLKVAAELEKIMNTDF